jgi:hypothetical protein
VTDDFTVWEKEVAGGNGCPVVMQVDSTDPDDLDIYTNAWTPYPSVTDHAVNLFFPSMCVTRVRIALLARHKRAPCLHHSFPCKVGIRPTHGRSFCKIRTNRVSMRAPDVKAGRWNALLDSGGHFTDCANWYKLESCACPFTSTLC